ncbi:aldo/keto reductase [Petrotoga sibirica]|uniref:Diketogulonate reductase-like aldo/keto reductase n=2 Tax=Petrotoga sibirica TaxID=156202 RepID=A0A4R8F1K7_9BACT|nr:aldo/keto reductase [Petrotoga sibirica]KUK83445.1 MAG: 2,5-didehydrogluconate reductase [Petrotoga mobilis]POZ88209.1 glyoxal reductase [Petrotoga sibirica DSM 13575]TDX16387.1 diketogulonate reductase-like aldo/keto reductase [Petrotoga sibirica]
MRITSIYDKVELANKVKIPWLGYGTYKAHGDELIEGVKHALSIGYRLIDTAEMYENEEEIGKAIRQSKIPRNKIFITSKVWNTNQGFESTLNSFENSLKRLGTDYLDLYLIHWPVSGKYLETWEALEKLYKEGRVRAIGVSNFLIHHLQDIINNCEITPMVNQVEFHPYLLQRDLLDFCQKNKIRLEAWSPLMRGRVLDIPQLIDIAKKYKKTPAQIVLRWDLQHGVVTIPKSVHKERIKENADIFDFELTEEEMNIIDNLDQNKRFGANPDDF